MGNILPKQRERSVLIVGLDNCGKTSLIANLKGIQERCLSEAGKMHMTTCQTLPTSVLQLVEYHTRDFDRNMRPERCQWKLWDMSGQGKHRQLWHLYAGQVDGIVFVIDLCDAKRIEIVHKELKLLLNCERIQNRANPVPIAFCLNKAALANELSSNSLNQDTLNEEEVRRGIAFDEYKELDMNVHMLPWHCGEDLNAALDLIARHSSSR